MIAHKHINKIVYALTAAMFCLCLLAMGFSGPLAEALGGTGVTMEYESRLFDTSAPITVDIRMDEEQWSKMLANASAEEYYPCDVEIAGQTLYNVGIRPKGNTSLSSIAMNPDTDRYSFKLEFDQFVKGQTCFGLDKLALNNNYADATNMKEALFYEMFRYIGADASLCNYARVSVNGEYWGVYLALEAVEDSFLLRNYGVTGGELYKPEGMGMGAGPGIGGGGADLNYSNDELDSYSTIWEGEVTSSGKADHRRVVEALKNIAEKKDLERYMDVDNLLRYMAVHVFSKNEDSLSGNMAHNYYLYEKDGRLNIIPWDYNLALGGMFGGSGASGTVNSAIDDSFGATSFFDGLLENDEYRARYHEYLGKLVERYVFGGGFDEFYTRTRGVLDELVSTDPTAFYTCDEYNDAAETLYAVVRLRAQSVAGQLDGTIPSTSQGQQEDSSALIDTGDLDLSIMGTMDMGNGAMGGGGGFGGFGGGFQFGGGFFGGPGFDPGNMGRPEDSGTLSASSSQTMGPPGGGQFQPPQGAGQDQSGNQPPQGFDPSQMGGQMPGNFDPSQMSSQPPEGFAPSQGGGQQGASQSQGAGQGQENGQPPQGADQNGNQPPQGFDPSQMGGGQMPGGFDPGQGGGMPGGGDTNSSSQVAQNLILYGVSFAVLVAALVIALLFKRRSYKR